jgi:hypothetical protein
MDMALLLELADEVEVVDDGDDVDGDDRALLAVAVAGVVVGRTVLDCIGKSPEPIIRFAESSPAKHSQTHHHRPSNHTLCRPPTPARRRPHRRHHTSSPNHPTPRPRRPGRTRHTGRRTTRRIELSQDGGIECP